MQCSLAGKWKNGCFKVKIKNGTYKSFYNGFCYGKGTIVYGNGQFKLTSTHAFNYFYWKLFIEEVSGDYSVIKTVKKKPKEIVVSNIEGRYVNFKGTWVGK